MINYDFSLKLLSYHWLPQSYLSKGNRDNDFKRVISEMEASYLLLFLSYQKNIYIIYRILFLFFVKKFIIIYVSYLQKSGNLVTSKIDNAGECLKGMFKDFRSRIKKNFIKVTKGNFLPLGYLSCMKYNWRCSFMCNVLEKTKPIKLNIVNNKRITLNKKCFETCRIQFKSRDDDYVLPSEFRSLIDGFGDLIIGVNGEATDIDDDTITFDGVKQFDYMYNELKKIIRFRVYFKQIIPDRTNQPTNLKLKNMVRTRDGYKCSICGSTTDLEVHHIDAYNKKKLSSYETSNCITLCHDCHCEYESQLQNNKESSNPYLFSKWLINKLGNGLCRDYNRWY